MIENLQTNTQPGNRYYRYDFLHDNCSTRIRDIIEKSIHSKPDYQKYASCDHQTFRTLLVTKLNSDPWMQLGFELMLGIRSDKPASASEYMFLPEYLKNYLEVTPCFQDKPDRMIASHPTLLLKSTIVNPIPPIYTQPNFIFLVLISIIFLFSLLGFRKNTYRSWFDSILFLLTGILGILLLVLWIGSLHEVLSQNLNILWASPLNVLLAFGLFLKRKPAWFKYLIVFNGLIFLLFIPGSFLLPQRFCLVAYLMDAVLLIRTIRLYQYFSISSR